MTNKQLAVGCSLIVALFAFLACTIAAIHESERTIGGKVVQCVGITESGLRDSTLTYEVSVPNVLIGVLGLQTVIVPAYVVLKDLYCPVEATQ